MADRLIRGRRTEDRGQGFCRGLAVQFSEIRRAAARNLLSSIFFCLLFSVFCPLEAEELSDPTRPPAGLSAPAASAGGGAVNQEAGLQSVIISKNRRAAIIGGKTVELGGKYGDAKLIEVSEGRVVLRSAQGRQVMTLFPDVKMTMVKVPAGNETNNGQKMKTKPQLPGSKAQAGKKAVNGEEK